MVEPVTLAHPPARPVSSPPQLAGLAGACGLTEGYALAMRIADAFRDLGATSDGDFLLTCICGREQRLDEMTLDATGTVTLYDCARCTSSVAGVLAASPVDEIWAPAPMTRRREEGGHRLGGYVVGSKVDLVLRPEGAERDLLFIPATPNFFEQYRYV